MTQLTAETPSTLLTAVTAAAVLTDLVMDGSVSQHLSVVDSLSSRQDFLSPHEHVIGVGVFLETNKRKHQCSGS